MTQDPLRQACKAMIGLVILDVGDDGLLDHPERSLDYVVAFVKAQRCEEVEEITQRLRILLESDGSTDDQVWQHLEWCEQRAKELEQG